MSKAYLLIADYEKYDFENLYNDAKDETYHGIVWRNNKKVDIKKGDIVYIYYSNMPDGIKRILIKSEVLEVPKEKHKIEYLGKEIEDYIFYIAGTDKYKSKNLFKAIFPEQTEKFSSKELINKYKFNFSGYQSIYEINNKELLEDLNKTVENKKETKTFTELKSLFYDFKCKYEKRNHTKDEYFCKRNGLKYFEIHHFIMKSILKKYKLEEKDEKEVKKYIYTPNNEIFLCANCHKRIHHANETEVKKMVDFFYESDNIKSNVNRAFKILKEKGKLQNKTPIEWIYELYKINIS